MAITDYAQTIENELYISGINYTHPEYNKYYPLWVKARDVLMGETELKLSGKREKYIPRLGGHSYDSDGERDYNAFVNYAMLYNATGRTVEAYRGLLNRKAPIINIPSELKDLLDDFTIKGESVYTFLEQVETEVITTNRVGIFIDYPYRDSSQPLTKAEVKEQNFSPYATMYTAESIINWEETRINNKVVTSMVVLLEKEWVRTNSFQPEEQITYRVLELDNEGYYRQVIVKPVTVTAGANRGTHFQIVDTIYPKCNGKYMREIPFIPITAQGITWTMGKSIIEDLINVNLAHFRDTAFYEKAIAWTASPTAVFSGLPDDTNSIKIGSSSAITIAVGGTAKYLEYEGSGITSIKESLESKENLMAILGTKVLATTAGKAESGEAALIHRTGEQSILADVATTISAAGTKVLKYIAKWRGAATNRLEIEINQDFTPIVMDANTLIALGQELQAGNISHESYYWALQRGELVPATRSLKEELSLIKKGREMVLTNKTTTPKYVNKKDAHIVNEANEVEETKVEIQPIVEDKLQK